MKLQANWQYLLLNQIARGAFMMHPQLALSHAEMVFELIMGKSKLPTNQEREAYTISAISESGNDYSRFDEAPAGSTAVFTLHGTMLKYGTWCDYGTQEIAAFIMEAVNHKNITSIVIDMDSGGGSVSAIPPLRHAIQSARKANKPVIASVDLCASAALWVATECNHIKATNSLSSEIGSIGVMMSFMDAQPYYEKEGYKFHDIYSSLSENKNEAFRLALEGKYDMIKAELLDPLAVQFQNHIKTSRAGKLNTSIPGIISGKTFFADDAKKYGLIDSIGPLSEAIELAQQLAESRKFLSLK